MQSLDDKCTYCGKHPYEYVHIGVRFEAVAVVCCADGIEDHYDGLLLLGDSKDKRTALRDK